MVSAKIMDDNEEEIDEIELDEKEFATGSIGYHGSEKVTIGDDLYQANFQLVKIGSKPDDDET